jgi:Gly-Xaa carboxypeptidase
MSGFSSVRSHSTLLLTKVNTWGLVYVWPGSDENLKPALLMAHQGMGWDSFFRLKDDASPLDVVPVNPDTVTEWKYPPYSGHYDGISAF